MMMRYHQSDEQLSGVRDSERQKEMKLRQLRILTKRAGKSRELL